MIRLNKNFKFKVTKRRERRGFLERLCARVVCNIINEYACYYCFEEFNGEEKKTIAAEGNQLIFYILKSVGYECTLKDVIKSNERI